jgi:hypothetical protein
MKTTVAATAASSSAQPLNFAHRDGSGAIIVSNSSSNSFSSISPSPSASKIAMASSSLESSTSCPDCAAKAARTSARDSLLVWSSSREANASCAI